MPQQEAYASHRSTKSTTDGELPGRCRGHGLVLLKARLMKKKHKAPPAVQTSELTNPYPLVADTAQPSDVLSSNTTDSASDVDDVQAIPRRQSVSSKSKIPSFTRRRQSDTKLDQLNIPVEKSDGYGNPSTALGRDVTIPAEDQHPSVEGCPPGSSSPCSHEKQPDGAAVDAPCSLNHPSLAQPVQDPPPTLPHPQDHVLARQSFQKLVVAWTCKTCTRECIPVRDESRCLCGHRLKEHPSVATDPRVKDKTKFHAFACTSAKCPCRAFFYIVAEGAWVLRCRCKHKHIDHDAKTAPFRCKKCPCDGFHSPWVCNCGHPWDDHVQSQLVKTFHPLQMDLGAELGQVNRTDLVAEPLRL